MVNLCQSILITLKSYQKEKPDGIILACDKLLHAVWLSTAKYLKKYKIKVLGTQIDESKILKTDSVLQQTFRNKYKVSLKASINR
jgi:carbamoylphosphate synthase large subunit